jgi:uncharacterized SAM-binding protein YcdF (DUF218 family)
LARFTLEGLRGLIKFIWRTAIIVIIVAALIAVDAWFFPQNFLCVDSGEVNADVLIVLGGGAHERASQAADLYSRHNAPAIILSGEGDDLINWRILREDGVPAQVIKIENKSETTRENALYTIKLLRSEHVHRAILVTTWYHSRRALKTFEHYAPDITFYSRPSYFGLARADWKRTGTTRRMRLEFLKLPGYWICYGVNPF